MQVQQGEEVEGAQHSGGEEPRKYAGLKLQSKYRFRIKRVLISENRFNVHGKSGNPERVCVWPVVAVRQTLLIGHLSVLVVCLKGHCNLKPGCRSASDQDLISN